MDRDASGRVLRCERAGDPDAIREVHRLAFGREDEGRLVDALRNGGHVRLSLVAEAAESGRVVGHILFGEMAIETREGLVAALALAPMAVIPEFQGRGIGSSLIRQGLAECTSDGHRIVLVVGHEEFYPRFGFSASLVGRLKSPDAGPWFMAKELVPGSLDGVEGEVRYPSPFADLE